MGLFRWFWERFTELPRSKTRLSEAQAIERARAAADDAYRERLTMTILCERPGSGWVWLVSEPAKGRVYSVEIDDATGEVLRAGLTGFR